MSMTNPETLLDLIVAAWQSSADVLAIIGSAPNISAYYSDFGGDGVNLEQHVLEQPAGTILVCHTGTRTGNFAKNETIKHDFAAYLKPLGRPVPLFVAMREGICSSTGQKFKLSTLSDSVNPPSDIGFQRDTRFVAAGYGLFDLARVTLTLVERGIDD